MSSEIGVTGLAVMGQNLVRNMARQGFRVAVHNRTAARTSELVQQHAHEGPITPVWSLDELVAELERPRRILLMVKAGPAVDSVIDDLAGRLDPGDIIVDGGNSHVDDTRRRAEQLRQQDIHFVGMGISGGEEGALYGPSLMPGGPDEAYTILQPLLTAIAASVDGVACAAHIGPDGAGHYVKMVHNGIEYAVMQLIAETYDLLGQALGLAAPQLAQIFEHWNAGELESFLVDTTARVLGHTDPSSAVPLVDVIVDEAEQKGTGRWTVHSALDLGLPATGMTEAVFARSLSARRHDRIAASTTLPGPAATAMLTSHDAEQLTADLRQALYASQVVAYAQGFEQVTVASTEYGWNIDPATLATIWRGGCIIRARLLNHIRDAYDRAPNLANLLHDRHLAEVLGDAQDAWRRVVRTAVDIGVPTPTLSATLAYYDGYRRARSPANLVQGLRDYFGAHTYRRLDRPGTFHTRWTQDGAEVEVE